LHKAAQPLMERLVNSSKETINLGVLDGGEVVVINTMESPQSVRMSSKIGNRRHAHSSALGKVLLAGLGKKELLRVIHLKSLPRLTPHTLSNSKALLAALCEVRCKGYAIDRSTIRKTSLTGVA
jgi:DNA-binding IclR family transcriptional regulator